MKKITALVIAISVFLISGVSSLSAASTSNDVIVLFNGVTEVNRETVNFLYRALRSDSHGYNLRYTMNAADIKPGSAKAVIVLSTGVSSGVDSTLARFIQSYTAKQEIILVSLVAGSSNYTVTQVAAKQSSLGVDTLTAASAWGRGFGGSSSSNASTFSNPIDMHTAWVNNVISLISKM